MLGEQPKVLVAKCRGCGTITAGHVLGRRGFGYEVDIGTMVLDNLDKQIEAADGPVAIGECRCGGGAFHKAADIEAETPITVVAGKRITSVVTDMLAIIDDPAATEDEKRMAAFTIVEAVAPDWQPVPAGEAARLKRERGMLADGIVSVAKAAGIIDGEQSLTGPQLLVLCENLAEEFSRFNRRRSVAYEAIAGLPIDEMRQALADDHASVVFWQRKFEELEWKTGEKLAAIRAKIETIVCTAPPDEGVILLSHESPTHYDPEVKGQVYDHEYFSPLGDALIELHKMTESQP